MHTDFLFVKLINPQISRGGKDFSRGSKCPPLPPPERNPAHTAMHASSNTVLYCTTLYCTVLHSTVLYCTVLHCTVLYCTVLYSTVLYCTVLYCTVLYCTVVYHTITVLYFAYCNIHTA